MNYSMPCQTYLALADILIVGFDEQGKNLNEMLRKGALHLQESKFKA